MEAKELSIRVKANGTLFQKIIENQLVIESLEITLQVQQQFLYPDKGHSLEIVAINLK